MDIQRKKEIINICLDHFIEKGLSGASTRSLSNALNLQNAGLYYYFANKDEAVILCANEALLRVEKNVFLPAIKQISNPMKMMTSIHHKIKDATPAMKFFVEVCTSNQYKAAMRPTIKKYNEHHSYYIELAAKKLGCKKHKIEPYVNIILTSIVNYMLFANAEVLIPQMELAKNAIISIQQQSRRGGGEINL